MTTWTVRPVRDDEFDAWTRLFRGYADFYRWPTTDDHQRQIWSWIHDDGCTICLVAVPLDDAGNEAGPPAGLAHLREWVRPLRGVRAGYLDDLFVDPAHRGIGRSTRCTTRCASSRLERGWPMIRWTTADDNYRARAVYDGSPRARPGSPTTWTCRSDTSQPGDRGAQGSSSTRSPTVTDPGSITVAYIRHTAPRSWSIRLNSRFDEAARRSASTARRARHLAQHRADTQPRPITTSAHGRPRIVTFSPAPPGTRDAPRHARPDHLGTPQAQRLPRAAVMHADWPGGRPPTPPKSTSTRSTARLGTPPVGHVQMFDDTRCRRRQHPAASTSPRAPRNSVHTTSSTGTSVSTPLASRVHALEHCRRPRARRAASTTSAEPDSGRRAPERSRACGARRCR